MQTILILILFCSLAADFGLIFYSATRLDRKRSFYILLLSIFLTIYTVGYLAEIVSQDAASAFTALCVENFGIPFIAPIFLLMTVSLFWDPCLRTWHLIAALGYGFVMAATVLLNPSHRLYYSSITMVSDGSSNFAVLGRGPLYVFQEAVVILLMAAAYVLVFVRFARGSRNLRRQMVYLIIGAIVGMGANVLNFSGLLPTGLDPTPFALAIGIGFFAVTLNRSNLTDVVLIALDTAVETMNDAIVVLDENASFLHSNCAARSLFPGLISYPATASITQMEDWPPELTHLGEQGSVTFQKTFPCGKTCYYRADIHKMTNKYDNPIGWSVVIRDVTDSTLLLRQLEQRASTDPLTGILNRGKFFDEAAKRLAAGEPLALLLFDVDWFKRINDTYGHAVGDEVLRSVTATVTERLGGGDVFGRLGGEEFVLLTRFEDEAALLAFAEELRERIAQTCLLQDGHEIRVTVSFGAVHIAAGDTLEAAVQNADRAMYRAKALGRNRVALGAPDDSGESPAFKKPE